MKPTSTSKNFLLLVTSFLFACLIAEVALRMLGFHGAKSDSLGEIVIVDDDVVPIRGRPFSESVDSRYGIPVIRNSKGWRDYEYDYNKDENVFRIVALGDSVLNAHGVWIDDVYAKRLEKQLNQDSNRQFEVVMLSLGALNTEQEAHLLEVEGTKYDPDLVLVGYVLNDPGGTNFGMLLEGGKKVSVGKRIREFSKQSSLILHTWMLLKKVSWQVLDWDIRINKSQDNVSSDHYTEIHRDTEKWNSVIEGFRKISKISKERKIPGVVAIFPVLYKLDDYPWLAIHSQIRDAAENEGLLVLDLLPAFQATTEEEVRLQAGDYIHPNPVGHKLASLAILQFLSENNLLCADRDCENTQ